MPELRFVALTSSPTDMWQCLAAVLVSPRDRYVLGRVEGNWTCGRPGVRWTCQEGSRICSDDALAEREEQLFHGPQIRLRNCACERARLYNSRTMHNSNFDFHLTCAMRRKDKGSALSDETMTNGRQCVRIEKCVARAAEQHLRMRRWRRTFPSWLDVNSRRAVMWAPFD